jgi:toxin ParE1/3/4
MKLVYHRGALRDLDGIEDYIARDNPEAAHRVIARIKQAIDRLLVAPFSGRPGPKETRLLTVPGLPYVVIHRVTAKRIEIVAVFHTSRDRCS